MEFALQHADTDTNMHLLNAYHNAVLQLYEQIGQVMSIILWGTYKFMMP